MIVSIHSLAQQIIKGYDQNLDGVVSLEKTNGYEAERLQYQHHSAYDHDLLTISWISQEALFQQADTNGDKKASLEEVKAALALFDTNKDGYFENNGPYWDSPGEFTQFNQRFPEQWGVISQQKVQKIYPQYPLRALNSGAAGIWVNRN